MNLKEGRHAKRGQVFRVYFYENGGTRNLTLTLNINDGNKAKRL